MSIETLESSPSPPMSVGFEGMVRRSATSYERELLQNRSTQLRLNEALAHDRALLREKDALLAQQDLLTRESDHRLLNDLQMIVSLLSLQSRASANADAAKQLAVAANRVSMIARVHKRLHCHDGAQSLAFKQYLKDLCDDFSTMVSAGQQTVQLVVEGSGEVDLPTATGVPLGFIVSELLTNAAKHGKGRIAVRFEASSSGKYSVSVSNDGVALPADFDPAVGRGLGMKLIRSFVERIGGELRFGRSDGDQGARFTIVFPGAA